MLYWSFCIIPLIIKILPKICKCERNTQIWIRATPTVQNRVSIACCFCTVETKNLPYVLKWFYWLKFKFRKSQRPNLNFWESEISLTALIKVRRSKTCDKGTFRVVAHWYYLLNELRPQKWQSRGFTHKNRAAKLLPTWQLMDVRPRFKLPNILTILARSCCFP